MGEPIMPPTDLARALRFRVLKVDMERRMGAQFAERIVISDLARLSDVAPESVREALAGRPIDPAIASRLAAVLQPHLQDGLAGSREAAE